MVRSFRRFSINEGLAAKKIHTVCQDRSGFIWLSTENGVFRFDGKTFHHYSIKDGLCDNEILCAFSDSKGVIWCAGFNGKLSLIVNGLVKNDEQIKNWNADGFIYKILEDKSGNIFLLCSKDKVYKVDTNGRFKSLSSDDPELLVIGIPHVSGHITGLKLNDSVYSLKRDIPIALKDSIKRSIGQNIYFIREKEKGFWLVKNTNSLLSLSRNLLVNNCPFDCDRIKFIFSVDTNYVGFTLIDGEIFIYEIRLKKFERIFQNVTEIINDFCSASDGNIWLTGSRGNLYCFKLQKPSHHESNSLIEGDYLSACLFHQKLYAINSDGELCVFEKNKKEVIPLNAPRNRKKKINYSSFYLEQDTLLFFIEDALYRLTATKGEFLNAMHAKSFCLAGNTLFFNSSHSLLFRPLKEIRSTKRPGSIIEERPFTMYPEGDHLWFSTKDGLYEYDVPRKKLYGPTYMVPGHGRIEHIGSWAKDTIALCTNNNGIVLLNKHKVVGTLNTRNGLSENTCKEIDRSERGWIVRHPLGLSFIPQNNLNKIVYLARYRDVPLSLVNSVWTFKDTVIVSTSQGLIISSVDSMFEEKKEVRKVHFLSIRVDNEPVNDTTFEVGIFKNNLTIKFALPEYDQPLQVKYQWKLNDNQWATSDNSVELSSLSPGDHILHVRAKATGSQWSEASQLKFTVQTPFWKSPYFFIALTIALSVLTLRVQQLLHKRKIKQTTQQLLLLSYEQKALKAMMNPHFIFNAMTSIQYLLAEGQNALANDHFLKLSKLIRKTLDTSKNESCRLQEELERIELYLQLEKVRLDNKLIFSIIPAKNVDRNLQIPTLILQTYVENAVIHGVSHIEGEGVICILLKQSAHTLVITILDNGPGFDPKNTSKISDRIGIHATAKRLELLSRITGRSHEAVISPADNGGTKVVITFPVAFTTAG